MKIVEHDEETFTLWTYLSAPNGQSTFPGKSS